MPPDAERIAYLRQLNRTRVRRHFDKRRAEQEAAQTECDKIASALWTIAEKPMTGNDARALARKTLGLPQLKLWKGQTND